MKFCSSCGGHVSKKIPQGDNLLRYVCLDCGLIHYQNPKIVAGCIVSYKDKVLLCRRAINPRRGLWTIPAGFMELGESVEAAAARETMEEALADVEIDKLFCVYSIPAVNQVHIFFRGHLKKREFAPGEESLEVALFAENKIPWQDVAFRSVELALINYFRARKRGKYQAHSDVIYAKL